MAGEAATLLGPDDPAPFAIDNAEGRSPFLLIGDHAGTAIPDALGDLGLTIADRARHIAVDIGVRELGKQLAHLLDAPFIHQPYSRLVIDCNRDPARDDAMPVVSDGSLIAGNRNMDAGARSVRTDAIHSVYHDAIGAELDRRQVEGRDSILLSLHSFTPVLDGFARPWAAGILHWIGRTDFASALLSVLQGQGSICVGDNQPYQMDATDYSIARHAFPRNLRYAEIEIRQDLISDPEGQQTWARYMQEAVLTAFSRLSSPDRVDP